MCKTISVYARPVLAGTKRTSSAPVLVAVGCYNGCVKTYSTEEAAELAGIHRITLVKWLRKGMVSSSIEYPAKNGVFRPWTEADVKKLSRFKESHYWEGRGRPKAEESKQK